MNKGGRKEMDVGFRVKGQVSLAQLQKLSRVIANIVGKENKGLVGLDKTWVDAFCQPGAHFIIDIGLKPGEVTFKLDEARLTEKIRQVAKTAGIETTPAVNFFPTE